MRLLVDTHTFLWFVLNDPSLSSVARNAIENPINEKLFSVASSWEMAIKAGLGKLGLVEPVEVFLNRELATNHFQLLDISFVHSVAVEFLPRHHKDPFDRMLAVQTQIEKLTIVSVDAIFDSYGVPRIW